jgi:hypothetical protein
MRRIWAAEVELVRPLHVVNEKGAKRLRKKAAQV